jgi:hypothetical protein
LKLNISKLHSRIRNVTWSLADADCTRYDAFKVGKGRAVFTFG